MAFWQEKSLMEMSQTEWESLCDGCGKCCLHKILEPRDDLDDDAPMQIDDTLYYLNIACHLLELETGQCREYENRQEYVPECVVLTPDNLSQIHFMPPTCSYRLLYEGKDLPSWHPLRHQGSREPMIQAGMATAGHTLLSDGYEIDDKDVVIITWPLDAVL